MSGLWFLAGAGTAPAAPAVRRAPAAKAKSICKSKPKVAGTKASLARSKALLGSVPNPTLFECKRRTAGAVTRSQNGKLPFARMKYKGFDYDDHLSTKEIVGESAGNKFRSQVAKKFGSQCFLGSLTPLKHVNPGKELKFPVCNYRTGHLSVKALKSAQQRANILKNTQASKGLGGYYESISELATHLRRAHFPGSYKS